MNVSVDANMSSTLTPGVLETNELLPMDEQASAILTPPALPGQPTAEPGVRRVDGELLYCDEWL
jgi:hypothetical protein